MTPQYEVASAVRRAMLISAVTAAGFTAPVMAQDADDAADELDTVVVTTDLPEYVLRAGDLGAVVQVYPLSAFEVEFVTAAGGTQAVVTLRADQLRAVGKKDLLAVRKLDAA